MQFHPSNGAAAAESVRREAELLVAARHPGVVELLGLEGTPERPVLVTAPVDGHPLAAFGPLATAEVAGLMAALASTLADVHDLGIVHGSVDADHVLVDADGRPVLCGFERGGRAGEVPPGAVDELDPAVDVAGLGHLLRRFAMGVDARPLRKLADDATSDDAGARPPARALAAALAAAIPGSRLPSRDADADQEPDDSRRDAEPDDRVGELERRRVRPERPRSGDGERRPRRGVLVGAALATAAAAAVVLLALVSRAPGVPAPTVEGPPATLAATPASTAAHAPSSTRPATRQDCPEASSVLLADVDGDGCLDALRYADGVLEGAGRRWSVGQAGDVVATGDWACRGVRTLALLRPSTGEVFPLDGWDGEVTARPVARVDDGQALRAADVDRDGCHELVVERGTQPARVLRLPRPVP
jgi:eukaryotic-like serine/threonine-protein kinase